MWVWIVQIWLTGATNVRKKPNKCHHVADLWLVHGHLCTAPSKLSPAPFKPVRTKTERHKSYDVIYPKLPVTDSGKNCVCIYFIWVSVIYLFICHCIITHRKNDPDLYACDLCLLVIFGDAPDKLKCIIVSGASSLVLKTVMQPHGFESVDVIHSHVCFVPFVYECA